MLEDPCKERQVLDMAAIRKDCADLSEETYLMSLGIYGKARDPSGAAAVSSDQSEGEYASRVLRAPPLLPATLMPLLPRA